jgi:hypothetical protein
VQASLTRGQSWSVLALAIVSMVALSACSSASSDPHPIHESDAVDSRGADATATATDMIADGSVSIRVATPADIADLKRVIEKSSGTARDQEVASILVRLKPGPSRYTYPSYYLAFVTAYLQDEGYIADADFGIGEGLWEVRRKITATLPRRGVDLASLDPRQIDRTEMIREFHGGENDPDPKADVAFVAGIDAIRDGFRDTPDGGALLVLFDPGEQQ